MRLGGLDPLFRVRFRGGEYGRVPGFRALYHLQQAVADGLGLLVGLLARAACWR